MTLLEQYGYIENETTPKGCIPGRVTEQQRDHFTVVTNHGEVTAQLKGSFIYEAVVRSDLPCVGDFVTLIYNDSGPSMITGVLPRRTKFSRLDGTGHSFAHVKGNREQMVAANFDYVFILTSLNRDYNVGRILRYLTQTWASGGMPVVLLTKADLIDDCAPYLNELEAATPGVDVHAISSHTGQGLEALGQYLQPGKTIVFLGMSGVGKSSLLNALANDDLMDVKATRKVDAAKGQHTTTHRQLFLLPSGALVMDTPGMRELGLLDEGNLEEVIGAGFAEIEELTAQCRFSDCQHESEPDCAIQAALAEGSLTSTRWRQYRNQQKEITRTNRNAFIMQRMTQKKQGKEMAKFQRNYVKGGKP